MAEQVFRSPGFFEREIDLSQRESEITGVPAGVIGTAQMGPAFVPVTVGSFSDFTKRFGESNPDKNQFGPFAVKEFLKNRTALTYMRVLGAGSNETTSDFENTRVYGTVKNSGFTLVGDNHGCGATQFIVATHYISASTEGVGYPIFSDNASYDLTTEANLVHLVRGMVFLATGTHLEVLNATSMFSPSDRGRTDTCGVDPDASSETYKKFKLVISSSSGATFGTADGTAGIRVLTASLDPSDDSYISKILNTDPKLFQKEEHLLYGDFAIDAEIAPVREGTGNHSVGVASGSAFTNPVSSVRQEDLYGRFDTRYKAARTTAFISQPYGPLASGKEYDLFHFEAISDGAIANDRIKASISNIRKSDDPTDLYGTFTVLIRSFDDTDTNPQILEQYGNCTLNPRDENYVGKKIGDFKAVYNFDAESDKERRVVVSGKYPNVSARVRIIMSKDIESGDVPADALPFGFRGLPVPKTFDGKVQGDLLGPATVGNQRLYLQSGLGNNGAQALTSSYMVPVPMTFKCTRGATNALDEGTGGFVGYPGLTELADARYYWGIKSTRTPRTGTLANAIFNSNASSEINPLVASYSKFLGIGKLDALSSGSFADDNNNNKFTLAKVALPNNIEIGDSTRTVVKALENDLTGSVADHMRGAAYIRNAATTASNGIIDDGVSRGRISFGSLVALTSSLYFNRFTEFTKFTNIFYGGFDGVNILDQDMLFMNDRSTASDAQGKANASLNIGLYEYKAWTTGRDRGDAFTAGIGKTNNQVASYRAAARIMTDPMMTRVNILAVPGQRDSFVTDYVLSRLDDYGQAIYLMDIPSYNSSLERIYDNDGKRPDTESTRQTFAGRAIDNNFAATYYPDISLRDDETGRVISLPSSIAAISALGFSDKQTHPWFAPAGFNRGSLSEVVNVSVRLNKADRDDLYDSRINPIASFPGAGFVIFGQKTLQMARSALDRVNVRRLLLEVKRLVANIASDLVFEQNTPTTRSKFVSQVTPLLATIQSQQGIDQFRVIMDETNNSQADIEDNRLNGQIRIVPTRAVEFIAIDFIITNSGVSFE
jgi:hypothetical protein